MYGYHTLTQTFDIGESVIAVASTQTHRTQIYSTASSSYDWPISSGRPGDDTPDGSYLTIEKANPVRMTGPGYDLLGPVVGAVHLQRRLLPRRVLVGRRAGIRERQPRVREPLPRRRRDVLQPRRAR